MNLIKPPMELWRSSVGGQGLTCEVARDGHALLGPSQGGEAHLVNHAHAQVGDGRLGGRRRQRELSPGFFCKNSEGGN